MNYTQYIEYGKRELNACISIESMINCYHQLIKRFDASRVPTEQKKQIRIVLGNYTETLIDNQTNN